MISEEKILDQILKLFASTMSIEINNQKYAIIFFHVPNGQKPVILKFIPFTKELADFCLKYIWFLLKANDYRLQDREWFTQKIKKRLGLWYHQWISMVGHLTLIKSSIEVIHVYWMAPTLIPKSILNKMMKMCMAYFQSRNKEDGGPPLCKLETLYRANDMGGWGLQNLPLFSQQMVAKIVWRLISHTSPYKSCIICKYISPLSIKTWLRSTNHSSSEGSIFGRALCQYLPLIRDNIAWDPRDRHSILIGLNSIVGLTRDELLLEAWHKF